MTSSFDRSRHGNARGRGVGRMIEPPRFDELGAGVPDDAPDDAGDDRAASGRFAPGNRTSTKGGRAKAQKVALISRMGLGDLAAHPRFERYLRRAKPYARALSRHFRKSVSGGAASPAVDTVVASIAWQTAASHFLFELAAESGDPQLFAQASKLANDARQNLLSAHGLAEMAGKAAAARRAQEPLCSFLDVSPAEPPTPPVAPAPSLADALDATSPEEPPTRPEEAAGGLHDAEPLTTAESAEEGRS